MQDFLMAWKEGGNHNRVSHYKYHFPVSQLSSGLQLFRSSTLIHDRSLLDFQKFQTYLYWFLCSGKYRSLY